MFKHIAAGCAALALGLGLGTAPPPAGASSGPAHVASWSHGLSGWSASSGGWHAGGGVVSYAGGSASVLFAPFKAAGSHYVVQTQIRLIAWRYTGVSESHALGILVRAPHLIDPTSDTAGLLAGVGRDFVGCSGVASNPVVAQADTDFTALGQDSHIFQTGHGWHTYRVEVNGNRIALSIDGHLRASVTTSQFASARGVGLFSLSAGMQARNFSLKQL